ncbi:uncharacterized protein LOC113352032 [Papaver somniferum]|uniref:uncharacterized protein LOC113352032 n=1 Tax=Papaver somniferum TaxID=3469 RepID=UPI000E6FDBF3|nr:uncharacterized protein LOC113352032 [Papaver somniferum]
MVVDAEKEMVVENPLTPGATQDAEKEKGYNEDVEMETVSKNLEEDVGGKFVPRTEFLKRSPLKKKSVLKRKANKVEEDGKQPRSKLPMFNAWFFMHCLKYLHHMLCSSNV